MDTEEWKPVPMSSFYEVSNLGRVRSFLERGPHGRRLATAHLVKPWSEFGGYLAVYIHQKKRKVQHLVLEAFIGPRPSGYEARHLNGIRTDNRLANLAWGTHAENCADQSMHGTKRRGALAPKAKLTELQAEEIRVSSEPSAVIARRLGVNPKTVWRVRAGRTYVHCPQADQHRKKR